MRRNNELIITDPEFSDQKVLSETIWQGFNETILISIPSIRDPARYVAELVLEIQQHPKNLTAHIQRIFICYREDLIEALYAALVDFLIVLNKRGRALSQRMVMGALSKLTERQRTLLTAVIKNEIADVSLIEGNSYSIFCRGLSGTVNLIEKSCSNANTDSDPIKLAQDAVEYSQLDEAMLILENALNEQPNNMGAQEFLIELYKSTRNKARFEATLSKLQVMDSSMADTRPLQAWSQLNDYFDQMHHE